jgi:AraC family transcriptional regulator of adaptative response / DNA-3-methyladenine glycosylase II
VAFASGFQSLRRFHAVFADRYRMPPSALRAQRPRPADPPATERGDTVRLRLPYRAPFAWEALLERLALDACPGTEFVEPDRCGRTVSLDGCRGAVFVRNAPAGNCLLVELTVSLLPALMPLLSRLHHLFDLDAEPGVVDAHLARAGLGGLVRDTPGLRVPGAFDGFEAALRELVREADGGLGTAARVTRALGEPIATESPLLDRAWPGAERVALAGASGLSALGVPVERARSAADLAGAVIRGRVRLDPGSEPGDTVSALVTLARIEAPLAELIAARALHWPDAAPGAGREADAWRPWQSYAAAHVARSAAREDAARRRRTPA